MEETPPMRSYNDPDRYKPLLSFDAVPRCEAGEPDKPIDLAFAAACVGRLDDASISSDSEYTAVSTILDGTYIDEFDDLADSIVLQFTCLGEDSADTCSADDLTSGSDDDGSADLCVEPSESVFKRQLEETMPIEAFLHAMLWQDSVPYLYETWNALYGGSPPDHLGGNYTWWANRCVGHNARFGKGWDSRGFKRMLRAYGYSIYMPTIFDVSIVGCYPCLRRRDRIGSKKYRIDRIDQDCDWPDCVYSRPVDIWSSLRIACAVLACVNIDVKRSRATDLKPGRRGFSRVILTRAPEVQGLFEPAA